MYFHFLSILQMYICHQLDSIAMNVELLRPQKNIIKPLLLSLPYHNYYYYYIIIFITIMEIGNMTSIIILSRSPVLSQLIAKLGCHFFIITNIAVNNLPFYSRFRTKVGVFYCGSEKVTPMLKKTCRRFYPTGTRFIFNREILT